MTEILLHDEVQYLRFGESMTSGPWVTFRLVDKDQLDVFRSLEPGAILHVTIARGDIVATPESKATPYGQQAKALRLSGFFRVPRVWQGIGTDEEFLAWLREQPCIARKIHPPCHGDIVAAHVRRIASGAGTAKKPPYSAVPLCAWHHELQHNEGETVFGGREWFDVQRMQALETWAWETLKATLGYEHWYDVPPRALKEWAVALKVQHALPAIYLAGD